MGASNRFRIVGGFFLILLGGVLLAFRFIPGLEIWHSYFRDWPMAVIGVGIAMFVLGLIGYSPGMAVPACIVTGVGGILLYQNNTGNWESWSYAWALIPGFVGIGVLVSSLLEGRFRQEVSGGLWLLFISAILFISFGAILGGITVFGDYWPVALILLGLWVLVRAIFSRKRVET